MKQASIERVNLGNLILFENGGNGMNIKAWQLAVHNNAKAHGGKVL